MLTWASTTRCAVRRSSARRAGPGGGAGADGRHRQVIFPGQKRGPPDAGPVEPSSQKDGRCRALLNKSGGAKLGGSWGRSQADTLMGPGCVVQFLLRLFEGQRVGMQINPCRARPVSCEIEGHEILSRSKMLGMGRLTPPLRSGMNQKQSGVQASMRAFFSASIFHAF